MDYVLYGERGSGSVIPEMLLAEADVTPRKIDVSLGEDEQRGEAFRKINPMGRLPALVLPDGTVVTESFAIALVIADRHPDAGLLPPPGSAARARALRLMALLAGELYPAVTRFDYPDRFVTDPAAAPGVAQRATEESQRIWTIVEAEVEAPFAVGAFSALDAQIAAMSRWRNNPHEWVDAQCPKVAAIARAVAARPKAGAVLRFHFGHRLSDA